METLNYFYYIINYCHYNLVNSFIYYFMSKWFGKKSTQKQKPQKNTYVDRKRKQYETKETS